MLDGFQRRVVAHPGGPLLVLAGPGTGKTTTLVEAVVDRVERRGLSPDEALVLTFSRKAAEDLRDRITARLGRTTASPMSSTFHSFCYALVRRFQPAELYAAPLRLLSAPEHDVVLRELLTNPREGVAVRWPSRLEHALRTRGFAGEVRAVLSRARDLGLDPSDLYAAGRAAARPEWAAAAAFMEQYLDVLDSSSALDYAELVHRAVLLMSSESVQRELRNRFSAVFVDEFQDTDPSQVRLLQALAGDGRDLVVVGDPDQSIYAFRGADVRGILDFPDKFRRADGKPADVVALHTTRRFGPTLLAASRRAVAGIGTRGAIDRTTFEQFRNPVAAAAGDVAGSVEVLTFSSSGSEAAAIADLLRRAHLEDGLPWSELAVLVRSGVASLPFLRRVLVAAGVPVEVAGDEMPLRLEPAVAPLLAALRCAADPDTLTAEIARSLLLSPLGGLDAAQLRLLGRQLRAHDRSDADQRLPRPSAELVRCALTEPAQLDELSSTPAAKALRLSRLLAKARLQLADGAAAEDALWTLWAGTRWPRRLRAAVEHGGGTARAAHRDLDAICALFELAARAEERQERAGAMVFLQEVDAQQIPGDSLADHGVRGGAVRLLTAHRSKGLEWQLVVVAGVQEGGWPDLRRRGSLLQPDRLTRDDLLPTSSSAAVLAEERRLFYVAVTRARSRLVVTAVASPEAEGEQPSRFIATLGVPVHHRPGRLKRALSVAGLVGELRATAADPTGSEAVRAAAAARLARLAGSEVAARQVAPFAVPATWWGMRERSESPVPLCAEDQPLRLTASTLSALQDCPLRWFFSRQAAGQASRSSAVGLGSVIHVLADHLGDAAGIDADALISALDGVWDQLQFDSPWIAAREHAAAADALRRFARWHDERPDRQFVASEVPFEVTTALGDGREVVLAGTVDRLERDSAGSPVVVDFKTGKTVPARREVDNDVQLDFYQLATDVGAFASRGASGPSGGAELVQLRSDAGGLPKVQHQRPRNGSTGVVRPVDAALQTAKAVLRDEKFVATSNSHCSHCDFVRLCPAAARTGDLLS